MKNLVVLVVTMMVTLSVSAHNGNGLQRLLSYDFCAGATDSETPVCDAIGTRSEGWYINGELMVDYLGNPAFEKCQFEKIECAAIGTRSEGWYISNIDFTKLTVKSMTLSQCSDMCSDMATTQCKDIQGEVLYGTCYVSTFAGCMSGCE